MNLNLITKDDLYEILKEPTRENFRYLLQNHLGEEDYLDFKKEWPIKEKIAKHILAIANSGGGCIVFGMGQKDDNSFEIEGLKKFKDSAELRNDIKGYIPNFLQYELKDFSYDNSEYEKMIGKKFQLLIVKNIPLQLPFICCRDGTILKDGDIYIRKGTESIRANNDDINNMILRKMNAYNVPRKNELNLQQHLQQLKILYSELTYTTNNSEIFKNISSTLSFFTSSTVHHKDCYPKEEYDEFVVRLLDKKKKRIEEELDI